MSRIFVDALSEHKKDLKKRTAYIRCCVLLQQALIQTAAFAYKNVSSSLFTPCISICFKREGNTLVHLYSFQTFFYCKLLCM